MAGVNANAMLASRWKTPILSESSNKMLRAPPVRACHTREGGAQRVPRSGSRAARRRSSGRREPAGATASLPASPVRRAQHGVRTAAVQLRRARAAAFRLNRRRQGGIPQARCARSPMPICLPPASCCCLPGKSACPRKADSGFHPRALAPTQRSSTTQTATLAMLPLPSYSSA